MRTMEGGGNWKIIREDESMREPYRHGQVHARRDHDDLLVSPALFDCMERLEMQSYLNGVRESRHAS